MAHTIMWPFMMAAVKQKLVSGEAELGMAQYLLTYERKELTDTHTKPE